MRREESGEDTPLRRHMARCAKAIGTVNGQVALALARGRLHPTDPKIWANYLRQCADAIESAGTIEPPLLKLKPATGEDE